jgi:uncharacterized protein
LTEPLVLRGCCLGLNLLAYSSSVAFEKKLLSDFLASEFQAFAASIDVLTRTSMVKVMSRRIAISPVHLLPHAAKQDEVLALALSLEQSLDSVCKQMDIDTPLIGGFQACVAKGISRNNANVLDSMVDVLRSTSRVCCSINAGDSRQGINIEAVRKAVALLREISRKSRDEWRAARFVVTANNRGATPYMPSAFHPTDYGDKHVAVSVCLAPSIVHCLLNNNIRSIDDCTKAIIEAVRSPIQKGEAFASSICKDICASSFSVDLSIAPSIESENDSIGKILELIGARCFGAGSTTALSILMNALRRGGLAGATNVAGLSGAFLPISEDMLLAQRTLEGNVPVEKLEALTSVCSLGLDMLGISKEVEDQVIAGLILDVITVGVNHSKATGARLLLSSAAPGSIVDLTQFDPLFGKLAIAQTPTGDCSRLISAENSVVPGIDRFATN